MYVVGKGSHTQRTLAQLLVQSDAAKVKARSLQLWMVAAGMGGRVTLAPPPEPALPDAPPSSPASPASGPPAEPPLLQAGARASRTRVAAVRRTCRFEIGRASW